MLSNYLKIAFRNLSRRRAYFLLNILGLTIGMTSCLLIFHYVSYERSFDTHIPASENIYRLRLDEYQQGQLSWKSATVYPGIAPAMKHEFPEIEKYCRLTDAEMLLVNPENDVKFSETKGYFAEQSFLSMFGISTVSGDAVNALTGPDKMIISEKFAKKYFGNQDPVGKVLVFKNTRHDYPLKISAVFKDYPANSHLAVEYLISFDTYSSEVKKFEGTDVETLFDWYDFYTYLQLKPGTDISQFESRFPAFCKKYMPVDMVNKNYDELHLLPVRDIHLQSNYNQEAEVNGDGQMVAFLFLIGIFIICIAWINYINLSTARSVERAKEVGVKKVLGAFRLELVKQFMVENMLLNSIAFVISICVFWFLLGPFDTFTGRSVATGMSIDARYWALFAGIFIGGTALSGIYPAIALSGFQPVHVLKGAFKNTSGGVFLRKGLIVFQFTISVILIAGTIVVYQQIHFMRNRQLGVSIDKMLVLGGPASISNAAYKDVINPFREELLRNPSIEDVAGSSIIPGKEIYSTNGIRKLEGLKANDVTHYWISASYDFVPLYDMKVLAGRNFSRELEDKIRDRVLINETSLHVLGFRNPEDAIHKKIIAGGEDTLTVIGVVADYHQQGLHKAIDPVLIQLRPLVRSFYSLKLNTKDLPATLAYVEKTWKTYFPEFPLNYSFLDDDFNQQYKTDELFGKVFSVFSLLAIVIACSGLLGLSAYNILQRSKEIGVRKVLGASVQNILLLLSKDFVWLIIIALFLAVPLGWYIMNLWLRDFAYRIEISWWVFVLAGFLALIIAVLTIVLNAYRSVKENPVKSLRTEKILTS